MLKLSKPTQQKVWQGLAKTGEVTGIQALLQLTRKSAKENLKTWRALIPEEPKVAKDRPELAASWALRQLTPPQRQAMRRRCQWVFYPALVGMVISLGIGLNVLLQGQVLAFLGAVGVLLMGLSMVLRASLVSAQLRYPPAGMPVEVWLRRPSEWLPR